MCKIPRVFLTGELRFDKDLEKAMELCTKISGAGN